MRWRRRLLRRQRKNGNSPKQKARQARVREAMARAFAATPRELGQAASRAGRIHAGRSGRQAFALLVAAASLAGPLPMTALATRK